MADNELPCLALSRRGLCYCCGSNDVFVFKTLLSGDPQCGKTSLLMSIVEEVAERKIPFFDMSEDSRARWKAQQGPLYNNWVPTVLDNQCFRVRVRAILDEILACDKSDLKAAADPPFAVARKDRISRQPLYTEDEDVHFLFLDTAGGEYNDRLMPLSYPQTDLFLLCFDVSNHVSFVQMLKKLRPELLRWEPDPRAGFMLVGMKRDLRGIVRKPSTTVLNLDTMESLFPREVPFTDAAAAARDTNSLSYIETSSRGFMHNGATDNVSADDFYDKDVALDGDGVRALIVEVLAIACSRRMKRSDTGGHCVLQ